MLANQDTIVIPVADILNGVATQDWVNLQLQNYFTFLYYGDKMNKLLNLINQEYVSNIYIGITSILVAVVIFIAEVIKDQNNELNKKVILSKTGIKKNSIFLLSIFFYMLIINMFRFDETNQINSLNKKTITRTDVLNLIGSIDEEEAIRLSGQLLTQEDIDFINSYDYKPTKKNIIRNV